MLINKQSVTFDYRPLFSLSGKKVGIPIFQRFYDWKDKQMIETLNDIDMAVYYKEKEIYLLDFIWYLEDEKIKLADGQQRLVSINILLFCIREFIDKKNIGIEKPPLFDISYDNIEYDKKFKQSFTNYMSGPFKKMYLFLSEYIEKNENNIEEIIDIIKNRIFVYFKKTTNSDDAFAIFTQINTGGKPLSKDEVMRTAIDQYSTIYHVPVKVTMKELKKTITGYYKFKFTSTGSNFDTIAIMSFLKNEIVKTKDTFQDFVNYLNIVSRISDYSISYIIEYLNRPQLFDIVNVMAIKGIDLKIKKEYLNFIMFPLCLLSIVMTMKKANPGGIIKSLYSGIIEQIKCEKKPNEICASIASFVNANEEICKISFEDFFNNLGRKEISTRVKEAILIIDVVSRTTSSNLNIPSINLEHIYPKKPAPEWAMNDWPTDPETRSLYINNIGNYLLLNEAVNKKIKNNYITQKVIEYNRIIPRDLALQTELNTVDFSLFKQEKINYIVKRQLFIANKVYENFVLGNVIIKK